MARQVPGPPPAPPVQKLRIRFAKRGRLRFSSHRDFQRALERALRRIEAPMAYSGGFNPHPKISFAGAAPTGTASEAEYFELGMAKAVDPEVFASQLDASLPTGLDIVDVVVMTSNVALADRLTASRWEIVLPGVAPDAADEACQTLLATPTHVATRVTKTGPKQIDIREPIVDLFCVPQTQAESTPGQSCRTEDGPCAILRAVVRHTTPVVRPDDVLSALRDVAGLAPALPPVVTRLAQGLFDPETGQIADPLAFERDTIEA